MSPQQVFAVLLLIASSVLSELDPACVTPTKKNGFCVPIERCRNIYNYLKGITGTQNRAHLNYIKRAACTLPDVERSICCRPEEILPRPIRQFKLGHEPTPGAQLNWDLLPTDICGTLTTDRSSWAAKTLPFEYPWVVLLRYQTDHGLVDKCGGSLINNRYVLTAAHCTLDSTNLRKVRLGEHSKNTAIDCVVYTNGEKYCAPKAYDVHIEEIIVHKDFNQPKLRHDIALIRLAEEIQFSESILPTCLPVNENERQLQLRKYVVTGWGATEYNENYSQELSQAFVYHLSIPDCERELNDNYLRMTVANSWQMCAIGDNLTDPCIGDSGGPVGYSVSNKTAPKFVQFGIVSGGGHFCGKETELGIYTRVSAYMEWIGVNMRP